MIEHRGHLPAAPAVDSEWFRMLDRSPAAMAAVAGPDRTVVYANAAFAALTGLRRAPDAGVPAAELLPGSAGAILMDALDQAERDNCVVAKRNLGPFEPDVQTWCCSVWPATTSRDEPQCLLILVQPSIEQDALRALQREVAERLLMSALRESDAAEEARASAQRAAFLADVGGHLGDSLDESITERVIAGLTLPTAAEWCIVDLIDADMTMHRLAIVHRDPLVQAKLAALTGRWAPHMGDAFGLPAVLGTHKSVQAVGGMQDLMPSAADDSDILRTLDELSIGALLTTPLVAEDRLIGAITFVGDARTRSFQDRDVILAEALALRSAISLQQARTYAEAVLSKNQAEGEVRISTKFLRSMGHELRTPLQAIAGYVEVMERGIHGPVTPAQQRDLDRIMGGQRHVLVLINELLDFMRSGTLNESVRLKNLAVNEVVGHALDIVAPLAATNGVQINADPAPGPFAIFADPVKTQQILINLLSNAVKFTEPGGTVSITTDERDGDIAIIITDNGRGIPEDKLDFIFEPFKQVHETDKEHGGLGLGLSISRDLAHTMRGDITVTSIEGAGSTFTLTLPGPRF